MLSTLVLRFSSSSAFLRVMTFIFSGGMMCAPTGPTALAVADLRLCVAEADRMHDVAGSEVGSPAAADEL